MNRNSLALIWLAGLVLAVVVYLAGPDRFVVAALDAVAQAWWGLQDAFRNISIAAFDMVRALAIGLYFVFVALTALGIHRGNRGIAGLIVVTLLFLLLIWHVPGYGFASHTRWMAALALTGLSALSMTRRLTQAEPSRWRPGSVPPQPR